MTHRNPWSGPWPRSQRGRAPLSALLLTLAACWPGDRAEQVPAGAVLESHPVSALQEVEEETEPPTPRLPRVGFVAIAPETIRVGVTPRAKAQATGGGTLRYEWFVNGVSDGLQDAPAYDGPLTRGDVLQVEATPYLDGFPGFGRASEERTVQNAAPNYLGEPGKGFKLDGHQIKVEDPDGDTVTFSLEGGPPGLSIGAQSGILRYDPRPRSDGKERSYAVTVSAEDGQGGQVQIAFPVTLRE